MYPDVWTSLLFLVHCLLSLITILIQLVLIYFQTYLPSFYSLAYDSDQVDDAYSESVTQSSFWKFLFFSMRQLWHRTWNLQLAWMFPLAEISHSKNPQLVANIEKHKSNFWLQWIRKTVTINSKRSSRLL